MKRRQNEKPETAPAVRSFIGAVALSPYCRGFYVTTADRFTRSAMNELHEASDNLAEKQIDIVLVDGTKLHDLLLKSTPISQGHKTLIERYAGEPTTWRRGELRLGKETMQFAQPGQITIHDILDAARL